MTGPGAGVRTCGGRAGVVRSGGRGDVVDRRVAAVGGGGGRPTAAVGGVGGLMDAVGGVGRLMDAVGGVGRRLVVGVRVTGRRREIPAGPGVAAGEVAGGLGGA
uniref:hypothetical protein n=1 Tax=Micromonospora sp. AKA109 TaxID=2733865 RepID=UPI0035B657C2